MQTILNFYQWCTGAFGLVVTVILIITFFPLIIAVAMLAMLLIAPIELIRSIVRMIKGS